MHSSQSNAVSAVRPENGSCILTTVLWHLWGIVLLAAATQYSVTSQANLLHLSVNKMVKFILSNRGVVLCIYIILTQYRETNKKCLWNTMLPWHSNRSTQVKVTNSYANAWPKEYALSQTWAVYLVKIKCYREGVGLLADTYTGRQTQMYRTKTKMSSIVQNWGAKITHVRNH